MVIAQFWAYANDVYTPAEGKRLFAVVALGASSGTVAGPWLSGRLIDLIGVHALLLAAAGVLALSLMLFNAIDQLDGRQRARRRAGAGAGAGDARICFGLAFDQIQASRRCSV